MRTPKRSDFLLSVASGAVLFALSFDACAQQEKQLGPVVVSASRTEQKRFDAAASVDAVTVDPLRAGSPLVNMSELLSTVPGIQIRERQNYAQDLQLSVRGFGTRSTFGVSGVRILINGIPATMPDGQGQAATATLTSARSMEIRFELPHTTTSGDNMSYPNRHTLAGSAAGLMLALGAGATLAAPFAYVPNEKSGTVSVIDASTDTVVDTITTGGKPRGLAIDNTGKALYVSEQTSDSLLVIDLAQRKVSDRIKLHESPEGVGISPKGDWVVVATEVSNSVSFVSPTTRKAAYSVKTRGKNPEHAHFSPDGKWLYVSAEDADTVDVVDVEKRTQVDSITVGKRPRGIAFLPDGSRAYVAAEIAGNVYAIDTASHKVIATIPSGNFSNGVTAHPDGKTVYVSNGKDGTVSVIDVADNKVVTTIPVGKRPWNMAITPDGKKLYVANGRSGSVSVIDTVARRVTKEITVGELPWGVVIQ